MIAYLEQSKNPNRGDLPLNAVWVSWFHIDGSLLPDGAIVVSDEQFAILYADYLAIVNSNMTIAQQLVALEAKADEYIKFGGKIWEIVKKKVFAVNTYNKSIGVVMTIDEMKTLLSTSDMLEKSLKSGSFDTSKNITIYLKSIMPQYSDVCDYIVAELNTFMGIV